MILALNAIHRYLLSNSGTAVFNLCNITTIIEYSNREGYVIMFDYRHPQETHKMWHLWLFSYTFPLKETHAAGPI